MSTENQVTRRCGVWWYHLTPLSCIGVLLFVLLSAKVAAAESMMIIPGDTDEVAQQDYDINDPRNPNCPCHQWQQQADEAYQQSQQQQRNPVVQNDANNGNKDANNDVDRTQQTSTDNSDDSDTESNKEQHNQSSNNSEGGGSHVRRGVELPHLAVGKKTKKMLRRIGRKRNGTKKWRRSGVDCFHF